MTGSRFVPCGRLRHGFAAFAAGWLLVSCDGASASRDEVAAIDEDAHAFDDAAATIANEAAARGNEAAVDDKPPPPPAPPHPYGGRSRAEALAASGLPPRFELACDHDPRVVDPDEPVSRLIVDLELMKWCFRRECEMRGTDEIVQLAPERIVLYRSPDLVQSVRPRDLVFDSWSRWQGEVTTSSDQCRLEPVSGFPPRLPRWEAVRPDDNKPHPFIERD